MEPDLNKAIFHDHVKAMFRVHPGLILYTLQLQPTGITYLLVTIEIYLITKNVAGNKC